MQNNLLVRIFPNQVYSVYVPKSLVPFALAYYHYKTHSGVKKMISLLKLNYFWPGMRDDVAEFVRGCILCSCAKHTNIGPNAIGTPRLVKGPRAVWQIDIVQGLPTNKGFTSFLNCVDMYTGYTFPIPLPSEKSEQIAMCLENNLFKSFGIPEELSSDNASNLSGPAVVRLLKFYNILHRKTTPYSPQSHGLIEIQNKNLTTLIRIFMDQFDAGWKDVITLASIVVNSVPRPILENHSPYFIMFGEEPFLNEKIKDNFFDIDEKVRDMENNRTFVKLLRQYLLAMRLKVNQKIVKRPCLDYPTDTLIYEKDFSKTGNRKTKLLYKKTPLRVLKQYFSVIYAVDLFGRVKKLSKNNIKIAHPRTVNLFSKLPPEIQAIIGAPLSVEEWNKIKDSNVIPEYFKSVDEETFETTRMTRQSSAQIASDSHVLEQSPEIVEVEAHPEDYDFNNFLEDSRFMEKLYNLRNSQALTHNMTLNDVYKAFNNANSDSSIPEFRRIMDGMDHTNILPTRTRRRVTFNTTK